MGLFKSLLIEMGRVWVDTLTDPAFLFVYLLLIGLVTSQYRRLQNLSEPLLLGRRNMFLGSALFSTVLGMLGGLVGSLLLVVLGVDLAGIAVKELWIVAILLMLLKPRFLCFSYAAGVISLSHLVFGYPQVNVPQLIGLVAILHLVETMLIWANGAFQPYPVYVEKEGQLRGGFNLQLLWPIPLISLLSVSMGDPAGGINMPSWWPILQNYAPAASDQNYALVPVLAMLGYGNIATTHTPGQAARRSAGQLLMFSLALLTLAILASHYSPFMFLAALFSPMGHELVIWMGMRSETQAPIYVPPEEGVMVLDVLPKSPAWRNGIKPRDIILSVNTQEVHSYHMLRSMLNRSKSALVLQLKREQELLTVPMAVIPNEDLGIIPVPEPGARGYLKLEEDNVITALIRWWQNRRTSRNLPPQA